MGISLYFILDNTKSVVLNITNAMKNERLFVRFVRFKKVSFPKKGVLREKRKTKKKKVTQRKRNIKEKRVTPLKVPFFQRMSAIFIYI